MLLEHGTQVQLIAETTTQAGSTSKLQSIQTDTALVTLWCAAASGDLTITVYAQTDTGKEVPVITFPVVSAPTSTLLMRRAPVTTQRIRVEATYTGAVQYEVYVRAINSGLVDTKIVGADRLRMSQKTVTAVPAILIPAALTDRSGLVIKNWSITETIYVGGSLAEADASIGYPIAARDGLSLDVAAGVEIWAISEGGSADIRVSESGG